MKRIHEEGNLVIVTNTKEEYLDFVIKAEEAPENARYVDQWSKEKHAKALVDKDILHLIIKEKSTNSPVGYLIIAGLKNPHHSIELKRLVITQPGKGYGREVLKMVKRLTFKELKAHRLWLDVRCRNDIAHQLYLSEGFQDEGVLRECILYNGKYESIIIMSILKEEQ